VKARAAAVGVSVPRLLVELATLGPAGASERNAAKTALLGVRRQIIGVATNINQLARRPNAREQLPPGLASSLAAVERMEAQLAEVLRALGAQP
jgi:Bacterial mobilisation protein (MobC)